MFSVNVNHAINSSNYETIRIFYDTFDWEILICLGTLNWCKNQFEFTILIEVEYFSLISAHNHGLAIAQYAIWKEIRWVGFLIQ